MECWAPILPRHSAQLGQHSCEFYAPAAFYRQGNSLVLIYVRSWVDPRTTDCGHKE